MLIMIEKDAATKVSKEVAGMDEARGFAAMGFHVQLVGEDGGLSPLDPVADEPEAALAAPAKKVAAKKAAHPE